MAKRRTRVHPDVITTVTHRKVRGQMRRFYQVRWCPVETERFPWGLGFVCQTLVESKAKQYARDISEYIYQDARGCR